MWYMWDKKVIKNIKKWVENCVYDVSEILFEILFDIKYAMIQEDF